jgi:hypothetical protein
VTELEQYGATYGLDETTLTRITDGLDTVRGYSGWEEFKIPEYIWEYVSQEDRDLVIDYLTMAMYEKKTEEDFYGRDREMLFAYAYALTLFVFWFIKSNYSDDDCFIPSISTAYDLVTDYNMPDGYFDGDSGFDPADTAKNQYFVNDVWGSNYSSGNYGTAGFKLPDSSYTELYLDLDSGYESYYILPGEPYVIIDTPVEGAATWPDGYFDIPDIPNIPDLISNYRLTDGSPVISGSMSYENYGVATGQIELFNEPEVGSTLTVVNDSGNVFTGVVTKVSYNLYNQHYVAKLADHVNAKNSNGNIEYTGGNIITVLTSIISEAGTSLVTSLSSDISIYSDGEETGIVKLFKSLCYALGASLRYNADGTYTLTDVATPTVISDILVSGGATREILTDRYANSVVATIDTEFTENVEAGDDDIVESSTVGGLTVTTTRRGEQVTRIDINDSVSGEESTDRMYYDSSGYITSRDFTSHIDGVEKKEIDETYIVTDADNYSYHIVEDTFEWGIICDFYGIGQECSYTWINTKRITWDGKIHLNSISTVKETTEVSNGDPTPDLVNDTKVEYVIYQSNGPIEQRIVAKEYQWGQVPTTTTWPTYYEYKWILQGSRVDLSNPIKELTMSPQVYARSYHLSATAQDTNAITALGEKNYEIGLVGISDVATLQTAANNILSQRARVRQLSCSVPINTTLHVGQSVAYGGKIYRLENVTHDVVNFETRITATRVSNLSELAKAINLTASGFANSIYKVIKSEQKKSTNIARGKVVSRIGSNSYLVHVQGDKSGAYKFCKAQFLDDEPKPAGTDVLLARPTGESQQYEILGRIHETPIDTSTAVSEETPEEEPENVSIDLFAVDESEGWTPHEALFNWEIADPYQLITSINIDFGNSETETILTSDLVSSKSYTYEIFGEFTARLTVFYMALDGVEKEISATIDLIIEPLLLPEGSYEIGNYTINMITEPGFDTGVISDASEIDPAIAIPDVVSSDYKYYGDNYKQRGGAYQSQSLEFTINGEGHNTSNWRFILEGTRRLNNDGLTENDIFKHSHAVGVILYDADWNTSYGMDGAYIFIQDLHYKYKGDPGPYAAYTTAYSHVIALPHSRTNGVNIIPETHLYFEYNAYLHTDRPDYVWPYYGNDGYNIWINGELVPKNVIWGVSLRFPKDDLGTSIIHSDSSFNNTPDERLRIFNKYYSTLVKEYDDYDSFVLVNDLRFKLWEQSVANPSPFDPYHLG